MSSVLSTAVARGKISDAMRRCPDRLPDARRDLAVAVLAKRLSEVVDQASASGTRPPTDDQRAALAAILARW